MSNKNSDYKPIMDILTDIFGDYAMHNDYRFQISFDCPVCSHEIKGLDKGDGKGNLEINYKKMYTSVGLVVTHTTPTVRFIN